jgi:hypothetical protein
MALQYSPRIVTDNLVMCLDASQNKSYPTTDVPVKSGLLLWLDAADDSTFSYSSGTEVSQWRDKSGNNFHANQATVGQQPSRVNTLNGRKSVNFTSANGDYLRVNSGMVFTNSVTAIVFIKPSTQTLAYANILDQDHSMDGYNGWVIQRNNTASQWLVWLANAANTTWLNTNAVSYADYTSQIVTLRKGSSTLTLSSNGTSSGDVAVADQQIRQANYVGLNIGYWRAGAGRYYNGEMCEIVVYNRDLSLTELKQVHTYLGQKWGISNTDRSIIDLSGNTNHGLLGNGTTADMPLFDFYNKGALKLDGSTDYVSVENNTSLNPTTVTVSLWVKRNGYQSSVASYLRRNYNDSYAILGDISADNVRFRIYNGSTYPESPNATLSLNEWTNIVGTYDLTNIKIYRNGVFVGQTAHTSAISYSSANTTMTIGRDDPATGRYMNANYGSVLIYNRALSASEIRQNYEAQKSRFTFALVQQGMTLSLDVGNPYSYAGAGFSWYDVSGNSYICTLINGPTYNNGAIVFDGTNDFVDLTYPYSVPIAASGNAVRSMFAWVRTTSTGNQAFISTGTAANSQSFNLVKYGSYIGIMGYNNDYYPSTGNAGILITDGVWHYIGVTFDGTNLRMYVDGILDNTSGTLTYSTTGQNNFIGKSSHTGNENYTNGSMGMVHVYNRALSGAEVLQNYNATKGRFGR